ncbi:glucosamine-6-phosphate deaminase, partial [Granulicatella adiacens]
MEVIVVKTQEEGAKAAFEVFKRAYNEGAQVFGLATGSSPIGLYELLRNSDLDFSDRISVNLDEYVGLAPTDEHSYHYFMKEQLFDAKPFKHSYLPDGLAKDVDAEVERYERILQENPVDLQLLGIGSNAHIGFNEPGTPFTQRTHKVHLTESTIEANKRFFEKEKDVPRYAYSMGLQSIMDAKEIVLIA